MNKKILLFTVITCLVIIFPINIKAEKICKIEIEKKEGNFEHTSGITISDVGTVTMAAAGGGTVEEKIYQDQNGNYLFCAAAGLRHNGASGVYNNDLAYHQTQSGEANFNFSKCNNSSDNSGMCGYGAIAQMASALNKNIEMGGLNKSDYGDLTESQVIAAAQNAIRYMDASRSSEDWRNQGKGERADSIYATLSNINNNTYESDPSYCGSSCGGDKDKAVYSLSIDMYIAAVSGVNMSGSSVTVLYDKASPDRQPFWTSEDVSEIENCEEPEPEEPELTCPLNPTGGPGDCDGGGEAEDPEMCAILATATSSTSSVMRTRMGAKYTYMGSGASTRAGGYFKHNVSGASGSELSTKVELTKQGTCIIDYEEWKKKYLEANKAVVDAWTNMAEWWSIRDEIGLYAPYNEVNVNPPTGRQCATCDGEESCISANGNVYYWAPPYGGPSNYSRCSADLYGNVSCSGARGQRIDGSYGSISANHQRVPVYPTDDEIKACKDAGGTDCNKPSYDYVCTGFTTVQPKQGEPNKVKDMVDRTTDAYIGALKHRAELLADLQNCYFMQTPEWYQGQSYGHAKGTYSTVVDVRSKVGTYYQEVMSVNIPGSGFNLDYAHNGSDGAYISTGVTTAGPSEAGKQYSGAEKKDICAGCSGNLDELSGAGSDTLPFYVCDGAYNGTCHNESKSVVNFSTSTMKSKAEVGVYQSASFSTEIYTGKLTNNGGGVGYLSLPSRVWPVPSTASSGTYPSTSTVPAITTQYGQLPGGTVVCPYNVTNELTKFDCDYDYHVCYPCEGEGCNPDDGPNIDLGVYFRAIDLNDVFPESQYSPQNQNSLTGVTRRIGSNWTTSNAVEVIKEIQKLNDQVWFETPQYTVTLNPATRAKIKKYNKNTSYLDNSVNCEGLNCSSKFLDIELKEMLGDKYENLYIKDKTIPNSALYNYKR